MHWPRETGDHTHAKVKRAEFDEHRRRSAGKKGLLSKHDLILFGSVAAAIMVIAVIVILLGL